MTVESSIFDAVSLYIDEPDFDASVRSIEAQQGVLVHHHVIAGMSEPDAHRALFRHFDCSSRSRAIRVKVDADMVIQQANLFQSVAGSFSTDPKLDRLSFPLYDPLLKEEIYGLHFWSPRVRWPSGFAPRLRTDMAPENVRRHVLFPRGRARIGTHAAGRRPIDVCSFITRRVAKISEQGQESQHFEVLLRLLQREDLEPATVRIVVLGSVLLSSRSPELAAMTAQNPKHLQDWYEQAVAAGKTGSTESALAALERIAAERQLRPRVSEACREIATKLAVRRGRPKRDISHTSRGIEHIRDLSSCFSDTS